MAVAMSLFISLELLTAAARAVRAARRRLAILVPWLTRPLPPVLFGCLWARRARVRLGREQWQGAGSFGTDSRGVRWQVRRPRSRSGEARGARARAAHHRGPLARQKMALSGVRGHPPHA